MSQLRACLGRRTRRTQRNSSHGGTQAPELERRTDGPLRVDMGVTLDKSEA